MIRILPTGSRLVSKLMRFSKIIISISVSSYFYIQGRYLLNFLLNQI
jgi:hypothetical protein